MTADGLGEADDGLCYLWGVLDFLEDIDDGVVL
jgi:hypothetical protein